MNLSPGQGSSLRFRQRGMIAAAAVVSAFLPSCRPPALTPAPGSNVILVCVDSLRPDHLGCYGYPLPTSPQLDRLAASGARFTQALANATWTLPSISTLFTSLYPSAHGMHSYSMERQRARPLPPTALTLARFLAVHGYRTAGFSDGGWVSRDFGLDAGFEHWEEGTFGIKDLMDKALGWIAVDRRPFLVYLHAYTAHIPFHPPPAFREKFGIAEDDYLGRDYSWGDLQERAVSGGISEGELSRIVRQYDAAIAYVDEQIGRLAEGLRAREIDRKTLMVVFADHGEQFLEHGQILHGQFNNQTGPNRRTCYDETIRIPLILAGPGVAAGSVAEEQISLIDLLPTLADYLGFRLPEGAVQGKSFLDRGKGGWALIEDNLNGLVALRSIHWKLILDDRERRTELYDLEEDPGEITDLSLSRPERVGEMMGVLAERERPNRDGGVLVGPADGPSEISTGVRDQLKSLGYIQ
jgi:arylsulfatase A-like enzyme